MSERERMERLMVRHLYLVREAAVWAQYFDPMDLAQVAMIGLINAASLYVQRGLDALEAGNVRSIPFETFARPIVSNEVDLFATLRQNFSRPE